MRLGKYIFLIFIFLLGETAQGQINGWAGSYYYIINNTNNSETLTDYQVRLTFNHRALVNAGLSKADASDIRFSDCEGNLIHHWIERGVNSTYTVVWIRMPLLPARSKEIVMMSYGNPNAKDVANADSVFEFFDDFNEDQINPRKWERIYGSSVSGGWLRPVKEDMPWGGSNYIYCIKDFSYLNNRGIVECEVRSRDNNVSGNVIFFVSDPKSPNHYLIQHDTRSLNNTDGDLGFRYTKALGDEILPRYVYQWNKNERVFNQLKIISNSNIYHYRYSTTSSNRRISGSIYPKDNWKWHHIGFSTIDIYPYTFEVNYVWVRKYTSPEPSVSQTNMNVLVSNPSFVNMGWLVCKNDTSRKIHITNNGKEPLVVTGFFLQKGYNSKYHIDINDTLTFLPGESHDINVFFDFDEPARYEDTLILVNDSPCIPNLRIPLLTVKDDIDIGTSGITADTLDFGAVCLNEKKDTSFYIVNRSTVPTFIEGNTLDSVFRFQGSNPFIKQLELDESRLVKLRFEGSANEAEYLDSIVITDTCGFRTKIYLKAAVTIPVYGLADDVIDFGSCTLGCDTMKTAKLTITNNSLHGVTGVISGIKIAGRFADPTLLKPGFKIGDILPNGVSTDFEMTFTPDRPGKYEDEIEITIQPCGIIKRVKLKGEAENVDFGAKHDGIDFGSLKVGNFADTVLIFRNNGSAKLQVDTISGISPPFSLVSTYPPLPAELFPGDTLKLRVRFTAEDTLTYYANVRVSGQPCDFSAVTSLVGRGLPIIADALVYVPNTHGRAGRKITIPLILESSQNLVQSGIDAFEARLEMNQSLLKPVNIDPADVSINGKTREIYIKGTWDRPDGILYNMEFIPALGDSECTDIRIKEFHWLNGLSHVEMINGRFCLVDICYEGGARLYDGGGSVGIKSVSPNPASGSMACSISVIEEAQTEVYICDAAGRTIKVLYSRQAKAGEMEIDCNISDIKSGVYFLVLKTPSYFISKPFVVLN